MSTETTQEAEDAEASPLPEGGEFAIVELLGHRQRAGYVTEVTRFGAALMHIDLPAKLWGGDQAAWEEYTSAALYGLHPTTEKAVRVAWEAEQERRRRQQEWEAAEKERWSRAALPAGDDEGQDDEGGDLDDDEDVYVAPSGSGYAGEPAF